MPEGLAADIEVAVEQIAQRPEALKALLEGVELSIRGTMLSYRQDVADALHTLVENFEVVEEYMQ